MVTIKKKPNISFKEVLAYLFVFTCFFPYLARPIGNTTGAQVGELIAIIGLIIFFPHINKKILNAFLLIWIPLVISCILNLLFNRAIDELVLIKSFLLITIIFFSFLFSGLIINRSNFKNILYVASIAILIQSIFAAMQYYYFQKGIFPYQSLFLTNPGLMSIANVARDYAIYNKRIFGWFPEPSAMAAAIGPWVVIIILITSKYLNYKILPLISSVCGIGLILVSASGYILFLMISVFFILGIFIIDFAKRKEKRKILFISILFITLVLYISWHGYGKHYKSRFIFNENPSWVWRYQSILDGFNLLNNNFGNLLFGVGPGQSFLNLREKGPIISVMSNYLTETGIFGMISSVVLFILILLRIIRGKAELKIPGLLCFLSWIGSVFFSTSYYDLLSVWVFLTILVLWNELF